MIKQMATNPFDTVPDEILERILSLGCSINVSYFASFAFGPPRKWPIAQIGSLVCRRWRDVIDHPANEFKFKFTVLTIASKSPRHGDFAEVIAQFKTALSRSGRSALQASLQTGREELNIRLVFHCIRMLSSKSEYIFSLRIYFPLDVKDYRFSLRCLAVLGNNLPRLVHLRLLSERTAQLPWIRPFSHHMHGLWTQSPSEDPLNYPNLADLWLTPKVLPVLLESSFTFYQSLSRISIGNRYHTPVEWKHLAALLLKSSHLLDLRVNTFLVGFEADEDDGIKRERIHLPCLERLSWPLKFWRLLDRFEFPDLERLDMTSLSELPPSFKSQSPSPISCQATGQQLSISLPSLRIVHITAWDEEEFEFITPFLSNVDMPNCTRFNVNQSVFSMHPDLTQQDVQPSSSFQRQGRQFLEWRPSPTAANVEIVGLSNIANVLRARVISSTFAATPSEPVDLS